MIDEQLATLHQRLAYEAADVVPTEWTIIYLLGEVEAEKASLSSVVYFQDAATGDLLVSTEIPNRFGVPSRVNDELILKTWTTIEEIYDLFAANNLPVWRQLSLRLERGGNLAVDYRYESELDPEMDPISREVAWAHETFGYTPPEGSYTRSILEEYLERSAAIVSQPGRALSVGRFFGRRRRS